MSRLTRDGTTEPVSRDQVLRQARRQGSINFPCSADHDQDWQRYPVDPYSAICDDHTYIHKYIPNRVGLRNKGCALDWQIGDISVILDNEASRHMSYPSNGTTLAVKLKRP